MEGLNLATNFSLRAEVFEALFSTPQLASLVFLNLRQAGSYGVFEALVGGLIGTEWLRALRWIDLSYSQLPADGVVSWLQSEQVAHLTHLALDGAAFDKKIHRALATSTTLSHLQSLSFQDNWIEPDAVKAIRAHLPQLQTFEHTSKDYE